MFMVAFFRFFFLVLELCIEGFTYCLRMVHYAFHSFQKGKRCTSSFLLVFQLCTLKLKPLNCNVFTLYFLSALIGEGIWFKV